MTINEKNESLAELLGRKGKVNKSLYTWKGIDKLLSGGWVPVEQMKFLNSWDWLMEVVNYIEQIGYQVDFGSRLLPDSTAKDHWCTIWNDAHTFKVCEASSDSSKIEAVHEACVNFAVWFKQLGMPMLEIRTADRFHPFSTAKGTWGSNGKVTIEHTKFDSPLAVTTKGLKDK